MRDYSFLKHFSYSFRPKNDRFVNSVTSFLDYMNDVVLNRRKQRNSQLPLLFVYASNVYKCTSRDRYTRHATQLYALFFCTLERTRAHQQMRYPNVT